MIMNSKLLKSFEDNFIRNQEKLSFRHAMRIFSDMWNEGLLFGVLPPKEPLDGIDVDIRITKVLNSCSKKSSLG